MLTNLSMHAGGENKKNETEIFILSLWQKRRTGIVVHVENLIKNLAYLAQSSGKRFHFRILTYGRGNIKGRKEIKINNASAEVISLRIIDIPFLRALSYIISGFLYFLLHVKNDKDKKLIIHAHYALPQGFLGMLLKLFFGYKFFITFHGSDVLVLGKKPFLKSIIKLIADKSDRVIVVSNYLKENLVEIGVNESKIEVVYNGIEKPGKDFRLRGDEKRVIFIGSLVKQKKVETLIRAFKILESRAEGSISDIELIIAGDGKERKKLEKLAEKLGIRNIKFLGYVENIDALFTKNSCAVLPSLQEGFGIVMLEAMIRGVPVIARRIKSIEEIAKHGENALLFENDNELAEAILKIFKKKEIRNKLAENGKKHAIKFTWRKTAEKVFKIYEN